MRRLLFVFLMGLALSGCSLLGPQKTPSITTYTLSVAKIRDRVAHDHKITLLVSAPTAAAGYDSRKMIYTRKPYELSEFALNQWAAPPAEMLEPIVVQKLRDTGYFHAVISTAFSTQREYLLKMNLIELRQDFTVNPSRIRLALQAELIDAKESRVINTRTFTCSIPTPQNTPYNGVVAANRAVEVLLSQVAQFCVRSLTPQNQPLLDLPKPQ